MSATIISWNVGLGNRRKNLMTREVLRKADADVAILQESIEGRLCTEVWRCRRKKWACLQAVGAAGGIIIIWKNDVMQVISLSYSSFSAVRFMEIGLQDEWYLTGVYGPCGDECRNDIWKKWII